MQAFVEQLIDRLPWDDMAWAAWAALFGLLAGSLAVLGKGADWLVKEAVVLSERSGLSKVVIGATVVSLGTTAPEAAVSVLAALQGHPGVALGNSVGSIVCDTGLIVGIACLLGPLPLGSKMVNRQGWVQLAAGFLLVMACWPWAAPTTAFSIGGLLPQAAGIGMVFLLVWYLWQSYRWARAEQGTANLEDLETDSDVSTPIVLGKLVLAIVLVVVASLVLIPLVRETAERLGIPEGIIAATLLAFGTSLPELVTAVTAVRHGHGELALGNIIGADILNVLFVSGAAAAVTQQGLNAEPYFFRVMFPTMLFVLIVFRVGMIFSGDRFKRKFGLVLLSTYLLWVLYMVSFVL